MASPAPDLPAPKAPDISELLELMHVVDIERQKRNLALEELTVEDQKTRLQQELQKVYAAEGAKVSPQEIDAAIQASFSNRYAFQAPVRDLSYYCAKAYVFRNTIALYVGLPVFLILTALTGALWLKLEKQHAAERMQYNQLQQRVATAWQKLATAHQNNELLSTKTANYPAQTRLAQNTATELKEGALVLDNADQLMRQQFAKGQLPPGLSATAVANLNPKIAQVENWEQNAESHLAKAAQDLNVLGKLYDLGLRLTNVFQALKIQGKPYVDQALPVFAQGQNALVEGNESALAQSIQSLEQLQSDAQLSSSLASQLEAAIVDFKENAQEESAVATAQGIYQKAKEALRLGQTKLAQQQYTELKDLTARLKSAYTVRIVNRPGYKSGLARSPNNARKENYYYLLVEAVTPGNEILPQTIFDEETQRATSTSMWAERVPRELYEAIKKEKQTTGRLQNTILVKKEKGFLSEEPGLISKRIGQVTALN